MAQDGWKQPKGKSAHFEDAEPASIEEAADESAENAVALAPHKTVAWRRRVDAPQLTERDVVSWIADQDSDAAFAAMQSVLARRPELLELLLGAEAEVQSEKATKDQHSEGSEKSAQRPKLEYGSTSALSDEEAGLEFFVEVSERPGELETPVGAGFGDSCKGTVPLSFQERWARTLAQQLKAGVLESSVRRHSSFAMEVAGDTLTHHAFQEDPEGDFLAPVVQFATMTYFVSEEEDTCTLEVIRIGDLTQRSTVSFKTMDHSAKAGSDYEAAKGNLVFEANELEKTIIVKMINDNVWESTKEFFVELYLDDSHHQNASLGCYASRANVKIIDDDFFPSPAYKRALDDAILKQKSKSSSLGNILVVDEAGNKHIPWLSLFWEYVKFNFSNPVIRKRSTAVILDDIMNHVLQYFAMLVDVLIVTILTEEKENKARAYTLFMLMVAYIFVTLLVRHVLKFRRTMYHGIGGPSRLLLQDALFRKYLEIDRAERLALKVGDVRTALTRDIVVVVAEGYGSFFSAVRETGNVIMLVIFQMTASLWTSLWTGKASGVDQLIPIVVGTVGFFPLMLFFLWIRQDITTKYLDEYMTGFKGMTTIVEDVASNLPVIAAYNMRPAFADSFAKAVKALNKDMINKDSVLQNNMFFPVWVATGLQGMWLVVGGMFVINDLLNLGMFLAGLRTIVKLGSSMTIMFKSLHSIETIMPGLLRISRIMNLPTELPSRKALSDTFRKETSAFRNMLHTHFSEESARLHIPFVDMLPIVVDDLQFEYVTGKRLISFNFKGSLQANQGELLCIAGHKGNGMSTLIRIIGLEIYNFGSDDVSGFYVPSHLRSLHVSTSLFVPGTLKENLIFGVRPNSKDGDEDRVRAICKKLLITDDVMTHYEDILPWADVLSATQAQLISLARAVISNPELLCLHKPTQILTNKYAAAVMDILREFVDHRGVNEALDQRRFRRPRTVIMSSKRPEVLLRADRVYKIGTSGEIVELRLKEGAPQKP